MKENLESTPSNDTTEDNSQESIATTQTLKLRKFFRKFLKDDSTLSVLKISATALTAVSMALISTRLTSIVNSLVLVAIVSALSAIVAEFYRIILTFTSHGARKVILTKLQVNPDGSTTETPIITPEQIQKDSVETSSTPVTRKQGSIRRYLKINPLMQTVLIFAVISAATIAASYFVSTGSGKAPVNNYTTVRPIETLPDKEKQQIIDTAIGSSVSQSTIQKDDLQSQIESLEQENSTLKKSLEDLKKSKAESDSAVTSLDEKVKKIEARLNQNTVPAPKATTVPTLPEPVSSPTATPTPTQDDSVSSQVQ
jgi:hypothetical protein